MKEEDAKRKKRIEETNRIIWDGHQSSIALLMQQKMEQAILNPPSAPAISSIPTIGPSFAQPNITSFPQHPEVPNNNRDLISSWMAQEQKVDSFSNSETENLSSIKNNEIPQMSQSYTTNSSIPVSTIPLPGPNSLPSATATATATASASATATATASATPIPAPMPLSSLPNMPPPPQIPTIPPVPLPMGMPMGMPMPMPMPMPIPVPIPIPMPPPVPAVGMSMPMPMPIPMPIPMPSATLPIAIGMPMSMPMSMPTMSFGDM